MQDSFRTLETRTEGCIKTRLAEANEKEFLKIYNTSFNYPCFVNPGHWIRTMRLELYGRGCFEQGNKWFLQSITTNLGLWWEHLRGDRDEHVRIDSKNG